jgi:hypothetical protein
VTDAKFRFIASKIQVALNNETEMPLNFVNGTYSVVGEPEPTSTPVPTATPTEVPPVNPRLNFKVKFRGVNKKIPDQTVRVKVKKPGLTKEYEATVSADETGLLSGSVVLTGVEPGSGYRVWIKGPKHLATVFCRDSQEERGCSFASGLTLNSGENDFDFSGLPLEPGDIAGGENGGQDGVVDTTDLKLIVATLNEDEGANPEMADLNYDGSVDTGDITNYFATISSRYDDDI